MHIIVIFRWNTSIPKFETALYPKKLTERTKQKKQKQVKQNERLYIKN